MTEWGHLSDEISPAYPPGDAYVSPRTRKRRRQHTLLQTLCCDICGDDNVRIIIMRDDNDRVMRACTCAGKCYERWVEQYDPSC